jgi:hypothetical protein
MKIHSSVQLATTYLGRPAITQVRSLVQKPEDAECERIVSIYWIDTNELQLRHISGTYGDVVVFAEEVIPNGTVAHAEKFACQHLTTKES